jgi:hypothetical protein
VEKTFCCTGAIDSNHLLLDKSPVIEMAGFDSRKYRPTVRD